MKDTEPEFIIIGTVMSTWGLNGHLKVEVQTDFPERFSRSSKIFIGSRPAVIDEVAWHKGRAIIKIEGLDSEEAAGELTGQIIEIHHSQLYRLEEGEYFHFQLVGLEVKTSDGISIGKISDILRMAGADIYVVQGQTGEVLIPATDEFVKSVNLEEGIMVIEPMDGLLDLNRKKTN